MAQMKNILPNRNPNFDDNYRYVFLAEWVDEGFTTRRLCLQFYPYDNSLQIFDLHWNRMFVRRSFYPIYIGQIKLGCNIKVFGKIIHIVDCSDETRDALFKGIENTFAMIKPVSILKATRIISTIERMGFQIVRLKKSFIDKTFAENLYDNIDDITIKPLLISSLTSAEIVGMEIVKSDCLAAFSQAMGNLNPALAAPGTIRKMFGESVLLNSIHGCKTRENTERALHDFFLGSSSKQYTSKPMLDNTTCCIIKPHAIAEGVLGRILEQIVSGGFKIYCMTMFNVDIVDAKEFLELYKGVLHEYEDMAWELASGPCVVMELGNEKSDENTIQSFRKMCGPRDPELARILYPDTIRAKYGYDTIQNAVHCTDLEEEAINEVSYFFDLLTHRENERSG